MLTAREGEGPKSVSLACTVLLEPGQTIPRRIILEGERATGVTIDCRGGTIGADDEKVSPRAVTIKAVPFSAGDDIHWSRPTDITIRNCRLLGALRTRGVDPGEGHQHEARLSRRADWTDLAQRAAPARIRMDNSEIEARNGIPLYLGPGTTEFTLNNSTISGQASIAIYLDQESARNRIVNNVIAMRVTGPRELVAVDGSAHNVIRGNRMILRSQGGGMRLYRNCGERGVIRHQTPSFNWITENIFVQAGPVPFPTIVENARSQRHAYYCDMDKGYTFGSSADDRDGGHSNVITGNRSVRDTARLIEPR